MADTSLDVQFFESANTSPHKKRKLRHETDQLGDHLDAEQDGHEHEDAMPGFYEHEDDPEMFVLEDTTDNAENEGSGSPSDHTG